MTCRLKICILLSDFLLDFYAFDLKRSFLNSHLHSIGLSITPACKCGKLETVQHFLIDCNLYAHARTQLFAKLDGLLEMKVSKSLDKP